MNTERRRIIRETLSRFEEPLSERALANVTGINQTDLFNELREMEMDREAKRVRAPGSYMPKAKHSAFAWSLT